MAIFVKADTCKYFYYLWKPLYLIYSKIGASFVKKIKCIEKSQISFFSFVIDVCDLVLTSQNWLY